MMNNDIHFIRLTEYNLKEYLNILETLSNTIEKRDSVLNLMTFYKLADLYPHIQIWIIKNKDTFIGCGTIIIEQKFIHKCGKVGHIEDLCILPEYQGKGYGKKLIEKLTDISKSNECYKIILNCNEKNKSFYSNCGFKETNTQMSIYFNQNNG